MKNFLKSPKTYLLLLIILIPVLIFAIFFSNYYSIYKDLANPSTHNSDKNVIVKNPFEGIDSIEKNNENIEKDKNLTNGETNPPNKTIDNDEVGLPDKAEKPSYNYIVGTYKNKFEKLQQKQENKLNSLIEQGKAEYIKNGAKKSSIFSLAPKYLGLINSIEQQADKEFDILVNDLKTELIDNSYETDIIKEIKDYYNYYKKSLRARVIQKATKYL